MYKPNKVIIAGFSGAGKTTLAKSLCKELDLPLVHIDELCLNLEKKLKPLDEVKKIYLDICSNDKWIIDGMYQLLGDEFVRRADLLIFIDIGFFLNTMNVVKRKIKHIFRTKKQNPRGYQKRIHLTNIKRIWFNRRKYRKQWYKIINSSKDSVEIIKVRKVNKKTAALIISKLNDMKN